MAAETLKQWARGKDPTLVANLSQPVVQRASIAADIAKKLLGAAKDVLLQKLIQIFFTWLFEGSNQKAMNLWNFKLAPLLRRYGITAPPADNIEQLKTESWDLLQQLWAKMSDKPFPVKKPEAVLRDQYGNQLEFDPGDGGGAQSGGGGSGGGGLLLLLVAGAALLLLKRR